MSEPILLTENQDGVATITLNRPQARNALSIELMTEIEAALVRLAADPAVKALVLAANGPAFCAGHDLKQMSGLDKDAVAAVF
ncbi:MAG TPA: enoyl-CoA hydratase-related protein, partial [Magnetospirillum sp.]|nr:enoyl-CoA hydratase-related protein [Magnetospirillum sp.]